MSGLSFRSLFRFLSLLTSRFLRVARSGMSGLSFRSIFRFLSFTPVVKFHPYCYGQLWAITSYDASVSRFGLLTRRAHLRG